ncbi:MAG: hypothetical protein IH596_06685 [Bacteroidales bacterium]|nr:hypothetical protein [Bacteroidales bacterium]
MDRQIQERVQKTLDFIQKDRDLPEDPWFYSRLTARLEKEAEQSSRKGWAGVVTLRLRPILVVLVLVIGIAGGIVLGKALSSPMGSGAQTASGFVAEEDPASAIFRELSGSFDEQILLMK